jgi:hypothetical protein
MKSIIIDLTSETHTVIPKDLPEEAFTLGKFPAGWLDGSYRLALDRTQYLIEKLDQQQDLADPWAFPVAMTVAIPNTANGFGIAMALMLRCRRFAVRILVEQGGSLVDLTDFQELAKGDRYAETTALGGTD